MNPKGEEAERLPNRRACLLFSCLGHSNRGASFATIGNPVNLIDPSGHCAFGTDENGNEIITKFDCTVDDFHKLTWEERVKWLKLFAQMHGLGIWMNDISGVIEEIFMLDSDFSNMDGYTAYMDAAILQAINDGWQLFEENDATGSMILGGHGGYWTHGGFEWAKFFQDYVKFNTLDENDPNRPSLNELRRTRLEAEQYGVDYAQSLNESRKLWDQESLTVQLKVDTFIEAADLYRDVCPCLGFGPDRPIPFWVSRTVLYGWSGFNSSEYLRGHYGYSYSFHP